MSTQGDEDARRRVDLTVFGDMDDEKAFLVAQGNALVICGQSKWSRTATSGTEKCILGN